MAACRGALDGDALNVAPIRAHLLAGGLYSADRGGKQVAARHPPLGLAFGLRH
jgi:hypothetical protein